VEGVTRAVKIVGDRPGRRKEGASKRMRELERLLVER